mgnify:CR=1 FL=1
MEQQICCFIWTIFGYLNVMSRRSYRNLHTVQDQDLV